MKTPIDQAGLTSLVGEHRALSTLDDILKNATREFDAIDREKRHQLLFGFVAVLAVSELSRVAIGEVKNLGLAPLESLDRAHVHVAIETAVTTAQSRLQANQLFAAGVWKLLADALGARSIAMDFRERGSANAKQREAVYADNVSHAIVERVNGYIRAYASATPTELNEAGIADAARMVDPNAGRAASRGGWFTRLFGK